MEFTTSPLTRSSTSAPASMRPFAYDARGNVTNDGRNSFAYDFANQPVSASGAVSASSKTRPPISRNANSAPSSRISSSANPR
jgi:hypothetical protein